MPLNARCDGHDDCGDEADEEHCDIIPENLRQHKMKHVSYSNPINLTLTLIMLEVVNEANPVLKLWLQVREIGGSKWP